MFELPDGPSAVVPITDDFFRTLDSPVWTESKARMIRNYVRYFIYVTHHGTYIDAFAGPQVERFNDDSWAAKLVLEIEPAWLRRFVLCELESEQAHRVNELVAQRKAAGDTRSIDVIRGDCNVTLPKVLAERPIKPKEATFCLLDQRAHECDWDTVHTVAAHKGEGNKIEIFYFLPVGWLFRYLGQIGDEKLRRWWGRDDIDAVRSASRKLDMATLFARRFAEELGYSCVRAWPIRSKTDGGQVMFYMIHAADHPEAPKLMLRAYKKATGALEPMEHLQTEFEAEGFDKTAMSR